MAKKMYLSGSLIFVEEAGKDTETFNTFSNDLVASGDNLALVDNITKKSFNLGGYDDIRKFDNSTPSSLDDAMAYIASLFGSAAALDVPPPILSIPRVNETSSGVVKKINKGQLNKIRLRPQVLNQHAESSRALQSVVTAGNIVGQIFKASEDNINGIALTLESAAGTDFDDFENYASDAALQLVWVGTDPANKAELSTVIARDVQSMELSMNALVNTTWAKAITAADYTNFTFSLEHYQTKSHASAKMAFFIEDSAGNSKSLPLVNEFANSWQRFNIPEAAMVEDPANTLSTDVTDIVKVGFQLTQTSGNTSAYVDNMVFTAAPGSVGLQLWDMGIDIPREGQTTIDDGTQYTELGDRGLNGGTVVAQVNLELVGGRRLYSVKNFVAGVALEMPLNTLLTPDNYYLITLNYIDTEVSVYGTDPTFLTNYYPDGYAFTAPDTSTAITRIGTYNDLMFMVFSTKEVYVNKILKFFDAKPGTNASEMMFIEDKDMQITGILNNEFSALERYEKECPNCLYVMPKGSKLELYYNDDYTDNVTTASVLFCYTFEIPGS
jgi:hypothetical protein